MINFQNGTKMYMASASQPEASVVKPIRRAVPGEQLWVSAEPARVEWKLWPVVLVLFVSMIAGVVAIWALWVASPGWMGYIPSPTPNPCATMESGTTPR